MKKIVALFLIASSVAQAQQPDAVAAYVAGEYHHVVALAEVSGTAGDLALAAQSVLADAISTDEENPAPAALAEAEGLAREALALDGGNLDARIQLAIALSLKARPMSLGDARRSGYGEISKDLAEEVLAVEPNHHLANGFLAVWNAEVVRRGGRLGALIMGAGLKRGQEHYLIASRTEPGNASIHWQWARALASINPRKHRDEINGSLALALNAHVDDALENVMQARAARLAALMDAENFDEAEALSRRLL